MDRTDRKILDILEENGRMSFQNIGDALGISRVAAKKRVAKLEESGIIRGYHAEIDWRKVPDSTECGEGTILDMEDLNKMIREKISDTDFLQWVCKFNGKFRFPVYMGMACMDEDIDALSLSVRSYNCLKRAGYQTINSVVGNIKGREDLREIRNMGQKSADEVMVKLFLYTYDNMAQEKKKGYLNRVREMNA